MAQQTIGIGASANDGTGDTIRDAFDKANDNFTELYAGLTGLLDFKGSQDCSANPNYPAASKGDYYLVSVAGKIGGASGTVVQAGDSYFATADNAGGTQASVGTSWTVIQGNLIVDNDTTLAGDSTSAVPSQHAVKTYADAMMPKTGGTFSGDIVVPADAYGAGWNGSNEAPTKNDVYDKIEAVVSGGGYTDEQVRDVIGAALVAGTNVTITVNDGADTITIAASGGSSNSDERTLVKPVATDYTLQNAGTSSLSSVSNGMLLNAPGGSTNIHFAKLTAGPASFSSFTVICKARPVTTNNTTSAYTGAIVVRNSSSGKILIFTNAYAQNNYLAQRWSSYSAFNATITGNVTYLGMHAFPWQKLEVSGGNATYSISPDGINWTQIGSAESLAGYISSIDEVGVGTACTGGNASVVFTSIEIS